MDRWDGWASQVADPVRERVLDGLIDALPAGAPVLEIGCGTGVPWTCRLAEVASVTAIELAPRMAERARRNVPGARIVTADVTTIDFPPSTFDAVVACYSLGHLPQEAQLPLLDRIAGWLRPGGRFVACVPWAASSGWTGAWLGVTMAFASPGAERYRTSLEADGWELLAFERAEVAEPEGIAVFGWIDARRPK